jgi:hypothetical protein
VGARLRPVRHDYGALAFRLAAPRATTSYRGSWVPIQPFDDAAFEGLSLGVGTRQPAGELGKGGPLVE